MTQDNEEFVSWAKSIGMDAETIDTIWKIGWDDPLYNYDRVQSLHEEDEWGVNPGKDGFVFVGDCPNGDPIAVDVRDDIGSIWYIGHESMHGTPLREVSIRVGDNLYDVYNDLCDDDDFPCDYYNAKEYYGVE